MKKLLGDIYISSENGYLRFGNETLELSFYVADGSFSGMSDKKNTTAITTDQAGVPLTILRVGGSTVKDGMVRNGRRLNLEGACEIGSKASLSGYKTIIKRNNVALEITTAELDWEITSIFWLESGNDTVQRDIRLKYNGENEVLLRDIRLNLPVICLGRQSDNLIQAPDYPIVPDFPLNQMPLGLWPALDSENSTVNGRVQHNADSPGSLAGLVGVSNARENMCLQVWAYSEAEPSFMEARRTECGVQFSQLQLLADRFEKGKTLEAGSQYIRIFNGQWQQAMEAYQRWYDSVGIGIPIDCPKWARGTAIYEVHVGCAPFADGKSYEPYPHMRDLNRDLPRIKAMGFEVVQLMPHWPYCGYTVYRYEDIDKQYGNIDEFREMIEAAHYLGLRVVLDIVMHGPSDREIIRRDMQQFGPHFDFIFGKWLEQADEVSIYRKEHPDWFMQNEEGETACLYTWAFDHANPGFCAYFTEILKWYLREFHVDGFRFDAPQWNSVPNWRRDLNNHASNSYYASYPLLCNVRNEIKREFPEAVFYTEPSGPIYRRCMDYNYNYDEEWLTGSVFPPKKGKVFSGSATYTGKRPTGREIARWFHFKQLSIPAGSMTIHHLDSHDTFWWCEQAQFRHEAIGKKAAAAMFSIFALVGGAILNYSGAEKVNSEFYTILLHLRQSVPELHYGQCDFLSAHCDDDNIFTVIRVLEGRRTLAIVNTGNLSSDTCITIQFNDSSVKPIEKLIVINLYGNENALDYAENELQTEKQLVIHLKLPPYGVKLIGIYTS